MKLTARVKAKSAVLLKFAFFNWDACCMLLPTACNNPSRRRPDPRGARPRAWRAGQSRMQGPLPRRARPALPLMRPQM
eukprot:9287178-Pyramimonas_sp.AAC.1